MSIGKAKASMMSKSRFRYNVDVEADNASVANPRSAKYAQAKYLILVIENFFMSYDLDRDQVFLG